uniref:Truncated very short patch repair endonuclease n=1 Tax=Neisseria polysaccharea TaxID=489 RepID=Q8GG96_NEIPO|nr:truncated very short patch repair endonuclease [Neisseria polysaccharea]
MDRLTPEQRKKMYAVQQKQGDEARACVGEGDVGFGAQVSEK